MTGQHPYPIPFDEIGQAYSTLYLCFEPGLFRCTGLRRGWIIITWWLKCPLLQITIWRSGHISGCLGWWNSVVLFPSRSRPYAPWEIVDNILWRAVSLRRTSSSNSVYKKSDKCQRRWKQKNNDKCDYRSIMPDFKLDHLICDGFQDLRIPFPCRILRANQ